MRKKALPLFVIAAVLVTLLLVTGCGKTTVTVDEKELDVETEEGSVKVTTGDVSEEELGMPVYPGAEMDKDAGGSVKTEGADGKASWSTAVLWTDDPLEKVISWYKGELSGLPGYTEVNNMGGTPDEQGAMFMFQSGDTMKTVTIGTDTTTAGKERTVIAIVSGSGTGF